MARLGAAWPLDARTADGDGDGEIVDAVRAGAHGRFAELVLRHRPRLRRVAGAVLRDPQEVEDAVQQAFLQAFASLDRWERTAPFGTWIARIAMNEALMRARRSGRLARAAVRLLADTAAEGTPELEAAARESIRQVAAALPRLARSHREVIQLAAVHELTHADVAARLGVTPGAVKVRLHRARAALRGLLSAVPVRGGAVTLAPVRGLDKRSGRRGDLRRC